MSGDDGEKIDGRIDGRRDRGVFGIGLREMSRAFNPRASKDVSSLRSLAPPTPISSRLWSSKVRIVSHFLPLFFIIALICRSFRRRCVIGFYSPYFDERKPNIAETLSNNTRSYLSLTSLLVSYLSSQFLY